ncbi:MAG: hypothetical protein R2942_12220 [Ignavibacteria bacterium]
MNMFVIENTVMSLPYISVGKVRAMIRKVRKKYSFGNSIEDHILIVIQ